MPILDLLSLATIGAGACLAAPLVRDRRLRATRADERRCLLRRFATGELDLATYERAVARLEASPRPMWESLRR